MSPKLAGMLDDMTRQVTVNFGKLIVRTDGANWKEISAQVYKWDKVQDLGPG